MNSIIKEHVCRWLGHKWKYNFKYLPSKRRCLRCELKQKVFYKLGAHPFDLEQWENE